MEFRYSVLPATLEIARKSAVFILFGFLTAGFIKVFVTTEAITRYLKPKKNWLTFTILTAAISLFTLLPVTGAQAAKITILHINDVYQIIPMDEEREIGGLARLKTIVDEVRDEDKNVLLTLSGDFISPSAMSSIFRGAQMIDMLNRIGLDYASPGNHEFDFGQETLKKRIKESKFAWLVSNVEEDGAQLTGTLPYDLKEIDGEKIGFFGIITPLTKDISSAGDSVTFTDAVEGARVAVKKLKSLGAGVIIALTHQTLAEDEILAGAVPGINLILGGHEHRKIIEDAGGRLIVKSGSDARFVGKITLTVNRGSVKVHAEFIESDSGYDEDKETAKAAASYEKVLMEKLYVVIGQTEQLLDATWSYNNTRETNLGNFITDVIRKETDADVAIMNGGGIRSDATYGPGKITKNDIYSILPFTNILAMVEASGKFLKTVLEKGAGGIQNSSGIFLQVSGLSFEVHLGEKPGKRIRNVKVQGEPLDMDRVYKIGLTDYILNGGGGYSMFKNANVLIDPSFGKRLLSEAVIAEISRQKTIFPKLERRIKIVEGK